MNISFVGEGRLRAAALPEVSEMLEIIMHIVRTT